MMTSIWRGFMICFFMSATAWAQPAVQGGLVQQVDMGIASGNGSILFQAGYLHAFQPSTNKNIKLGYGLRFSWLQSFDALEYVTAPARIRTGETGFQSLWRSSVATRLDTFVTENPALGSVNLGLYAAYFFNPLFEAGLYAEIIGFGFGAQQDGIYNSPNQDHIPLTVSAHPEKFNFLPISRGAYQAELFARYWMLPRLGWKAGLNFYRSEYVTDQQLNFDNKRFKNVFVMFAVAISYRWGAGN